MAAYAIDAMVLTIVGAAAAAIVSGVVGPALTAVPDGGGTVRLMLDPARLVLQASVAAAVSAAYFAAGWSGPWAATLGQRALRITVASAESGQRLAVSRSLVRWLWLGAPVAVPAALAIESAILWSLIVLVAVIWTIALLVTTLLNPQRRGLHDLFSGTVVTR